MPFNAEFNAYEHEPRQGGGAHPVGNKFPFTITNTFVKPTKSGTGGIFEVEFTSPAGSIKNNYNLWNESESARKFAANELSALCHATGVFKVDFKNDGAALRGGKGLMDVNFQKGHEPSAEKPEGGYVELKKVYDVAGNEPGKTNQPQQQQPQQQNGFGQQPQVQQNSGFAPNPQQQQNPPQNQQQPQNNNWGGQPQQQTNPPQQQQQPQQQGGWTQGNGGNMPQTAPWGAG